MPPGVATPVARSADNMKPGAKTPMDQYAIGRATPWCVRLCNADLSEAGVSVRPDGRISRR
jgi:hypothetical protein